LASAAGWLLISQLLSNNRAAKSGRKEKSEQRLRRAVCWSAIKNVAKYFLCGVESLVLWGETHG